MYIKGIQVLQERINNKKYPFNIGAISNLNELSFSSNVTFFIGENGTGKSTLLEAIAIASGFNPEGGSKNMKFSTFDSHSNLSESILLKKSGIPPKDGFF